MMAPLVNHNGVIKKNMLNKRVNTDSLKLAGYPTGYVYEFYKNEAANGQRR